MHELLIRMNDLFQSWGVHGLALNSFIESFFLVPPPDFLLITMDLAKPEKALFYATVCTFASLLGGMFGYALGYWGGRPVFNFIFRNKHEQFEGVEKTIFRMYYLERKNQEIIAKFLGNTQSYVSKHLQKIKKVVELSDLRRDDQSKREAYAEQQWEKFLDQYRTDGDEDILFDMFRCICGPDLQEAFLEWFYSYREYSKFCLQYLILRSFDHCEDDELDRRLTALAEWQQLTFHLQFAEHIDEMQWLYLALCEKINARQKELKTPPSHPDEKKIQREAEKTARRLGLTVEEYIEGRFLPKMYEQLEKRYTDFRRKYKNVVVVDENDPRSIQEQIKEIFGDGPDPKFRNPEFDKQ